MIAVVGISFSARGSSFDSASLESRARRCPCFDLLCSADGSNMWNYRFAAYDQYVTQQAIR